MAFNLYSINTGFYINSSGYVGILNSNPQYPLDISGSCKANAFIGNSISGKIISGDTFTTQNFVVNTFSATNFTGVNFSGQNFTGSVFTGKNFYGGNFSGEDVIFKHLIAPFTGNGYMKSSINNGAGSVTVIGSDSAGQIIMGVVSATTSQTTITVTFNKPYSYDPIIVFSPVDGSTALEGFSCYATTNSFILSRGSSYPIPNDGSYRWNYIVIGI